MFGASPIGLEDRRKIDTQLSRKPFRKEAKRSSPLQCFREHQMMADIPDGLRAAYKGRHKPAAADFSLREQG
jgi:hypothetical protein